MLESPFLKGVKVIVVYPNGYTKLGVIQRLYKSGNFCLEGEGNKQWRPLVRYTSSREIKWHAQPTSRATRAPRSKLEPLPTVYLDTPVARERLWMRPEDEYSRLYPRRSGENKGAA